MNITDELIKIFASWTKLKIRLHITGVQRFPEEKQIWLASLGQNVGVEINGKNEKFERPALVIKKYNRDAMLVLPVSSKKTDDIYHITFVDNEGRENIVNLSQSRMISAKRFIRKMSKIDNEIFKQIKEKFINSV